METIQVRDANGVRSYMKVEGEGTEINPYMSSVVSKDISSGIPPEFTKQTANGETYLLQKGQLNNLRIRPQIWNEHAESSRSIIANVTNTNIVGQVFKASQDNINGIDLALESAGGVTVDDFENYANDTELNLAWIASNAANEAAVETSVVYEGAKSMYLDTGTGFTGNEWAKSFTAEDYTGRTLQFQLQSNKEYKDVKMIVFIEDSVGNKASRQIVQANRDIWTKLVTPINTFIDESASTDLTDIVKVGYRIEQEKKDGYVIIDILNSIPAPGTVEIKLWDMGATLPQTGITSLSDGTQYEKLGDLGTTGAQTASVMVDLLGGKRIYHIDRFVAGVALEMPTNEILITGNYYAITIHHVDTDVQVYGPNATLDNYYNNGYSFTTPNESNVITSTGANEDLMFIIFSTQVVYVYEVTIVTDGIPDGGSRTSAYVEDENMKRTDILVSGIKAVPSITTVLQKPFKMTKGSKFEQEYNDDFTDNVTSINLIIQYMFIPPQVNG